MKLQPVIDRLAGEVAALKVVDGAATVQAALATVPRQSAAFVFPVADTAVRRNNFAAGATIQEVSERFGVLIVARDAGDAKGGRQADAIDTLKDAVADALVGWSHPDAEGPTLYAQGRMLSLQDRAVTWLSEFTVKTTIRKT